MGRRSFGVLIAALFVVASAIAGPPSFAAQRADPGPGPASLPLSAEAQDRYVVLFAEAPLALYAGGVAGLAPTMPAAIGETRLDPSSAASLAYYAYLDTQHAAHLAAIEAAIARPVTVIFRYRTAVNGVAISLTPTEAASVRGVAGVTRVHREEYYELLTDNGPKWMNADAVWTGAATGVASKGEGIVAGIIDTGVNSDHPSFADIGADGYDHSNPRLKHYGVCAPLNPLLCNDKLIGMYDFTGTGHEDDNGHGSHTASTVAGNVVDATVYAPTVTVGPRRISGVAPHANVISYKACTSTVFPVLGSCPLTAIYASVEQATADVVDVINFSIGGGSSDPWTGILGQPFFGTQAAGVFVAASAGNAGPNPQTIGSPSNAPWVMSVGASTHDRRPTGTVTTSSATGAGPSFTGMTVTSGLASTALIDAKSLGNEVCNPFDPAQAAAIAGKVVICTQGVIGRVAKGVNVKNAGGAGMILTSQPGAKASVVSDTHVLPTVMISEWDGDALRAWLGTAVAPRAALSGITLEESPSLADRMAYFSSRGPDLTSPNVIKPDVTAPGVAIWAAFSSHSGPAGTAEYNIIQGTSMSSPHAAGAAALVRAVNRAWTPDNVKSALMSTGFTSPTGGKETVPVTKEDHTTAADPFDMGGGRVDVARAAKAGIVLQETLANYQSANPAIGGDPRKLNLASMANDDCKVSCTWTRTLTSAANRSVTWTASASGSSAFSLAVQPATFTLAPGLLGTPATQVLSVTATNTALVPGSWQFGTVTLTPNDLSIPAQRFPVAIKTKGGNVTPACEIPFTKVVTDPAEPTTIQPQHDVREVAVAGLYPTFAGQATPNVTFRLKVATLDPLPAESFWQVTFVPPGTAAGSSYFVRMATGPTGGPSFTYGTITGTSFTTVGAPENGSYRPDGTIDITIAASKIGNVKVGDTITGIAGAAGTGHPGLFTSGRDSTASGTYTLRGCEDTGPIANADSATTTERTPVIIDVLANDASPNGSQLTVVEVGQPSNGTAVNNNNGTVTYTPNAGFNGADSFGYTISDPQGRRASSTVTVRVAPFCPTTGKAYDFESGPAGWTVQTAANDFPSATWAIRPDALAKSGTNSFNTDDPSWTKDDRLIAPAVNISSVGLISFWHRYATEDGFDGGVLEVSSDGGTTWTDVVAAGGVFQKGGYNGSISSSDGSAIAGRKAWTGGSATSSMTEVVVDVGALAGQGVLFRWRFVTDALVPGVGWWVDDVAFTGLATDCNEPPVAVNDTAVTQADTAVTIAVLANDGDPDGDPLSVGAVSDPANGTVTINADNTVTYTPDPGFLGTDTFTYTAFDGEYEDTATVTVTVEKRPNTAPVANADAAITPRNTSATIAVLDNDTDADGDTLTLTGVTQPSNGTATANANGTVTYTPALNFNGTDSFTYSISDGHGGSATGNVTVTVGQPGAPVACFTTAPKRPTEDANTTFFAKCTKDDKVPSDQLIFTWDFQSDGVTDATGIKAFHSYEAPGTYRVTLRVTDPDGNTDVLIRELEVRPN